MYSRFSRKTYLGLALLVVLALSLMLLGLTHFTVHAKAATAAIRLSKVTGPPTTTVIVTGTGFGNSETVSATFDTTTTLGTTTTDNTGSFSLSIKIPAAAQPGYHEVKAIGQRSGLTASSPFHVRTDWAQFGFDAQHRGFNSYENVLSSSNVSGLTLDWSYPKGIQNNYDGYTAPPAVANGLVYVGSDKLYVLNSKTGALKWSYTTGSDVSAPSVFNGMVYVSSADHLYALNAITGVLEWNYALAETISSPLAVTKQIVYVGSSAAKLYALDAMKGMLKWSYALKKTIYNTLSASPVVENGIVYVGSSDKNNDNTYLYALNATTGAFIWRNAVGGCGLTGAPAVANGILYISSDANDGNNCNPVFGNNLLALDALTGASIWSTTAACAYWESTQNTSPVVANNVLYITSNNYDHSSGGDFWTESAFNLKTGSRLWCYDDYNNQQDYLVASPAVVANGVVYIDSSYADAQLYAFHLPGITP